MRVSNWIASILFATLAVAACAAVPDIAMADDALYGTFYNGGQSFTFAGINTSAPGAGKATRIFDFNLPVGTGIGAMAYDPRSGKFVITSGSANGSVFEIDALNATVSSPRPVIGLPAGSSVQGIEYHPDEGMVISFGQANTNNRFAVINPSDGTLVPPPRVTGAFPGIPDADAMVYIQTIPGIPSPGKFIVTDGNDPPFKTLSNIFGPLTPTSTDYANPTSDGNLFDAAASNEGPDAGTIYFSRRGDPNQATSALVRLNNAGTGYDVIGQFLFAPGNFASGLAFGPSSIPEPCTLSLLAMGSMLVLSRRRRLV